MRLYLQHLNLRSSDALDSWIEQQILTLGESQVIEEANIRLTRLRETSPGYLVNLHLVVPGPDLVVEGRDYTIQAAVDKVMRRLREQIAQRAQKARRRLKSQRSISRVNVRSPAANASARS